MFQDNMLVVSVCALALLAVAPANAELTYLSAIGTSLLRCTEEGAPVTYSISGIGDIYAMCRNPSTNEVLAISTDPSGGVVHRIDNAFSGTPTVTPIATLARRYGTISEINGTLYALQDGTLYELDLSDPGNPGENVIGYTGIDGTGGSGYDPTTNTWYVTSTSDDKLYTVDPLTAASVELGSFGVDLGTQGAEWFDGALHVMTQNNGSGSVEIGTLDMTNGTYTRSFDLIPGGGDIISGAMTVIPEPTTALLLAIGLVAIARRR